MTPRDRGSVTAFITVIAIALVAIAGLVLDAGSALTTKTSAMDTAQAAARAGANSLDLTAYRLGEPARIDPAAAEAAALDWLHRAGTTGTITATTTDVTVTITDHHPTQILTIVGISTLTVTATATATVRTGPQGGP